MRHRLRLLLEQGGIALPKTVTADSLRRLLETYPDMTEVLLLWAALELRLPLLDVPLVPADLREGGVTEYSRRLREAAQLWCGKEAAAGDNPDDAGTNT